MEDTSRPADSVQPDSVNKNITAYKVTLSILFGLLGFGVNFFTINFAFPPYTATVLIGLLFPMLITLAWGWKYGLLSALAGGCQSMWWLWGPSNGYATFFVVPPFTLWIVWHGFVANWRKKQTAHPWWLYEYVVEIPFRILSTINLYTLSRWAITLNPPPWGWASGAPNTIPMHFSNFVVIKQAVVGYVILLLADVLLHLGFVRKFFGLEEEYDQTNTNHIISASLLIGIFIWLVDSVIGYLVFHTEDSLLDLLALNIHPHDIFMRAMFILACLMGGLLTSYLLRRQRESDQALLESEARYRLLFERSLASVYLSTLDGQVLDCNAAFAHLLGYDSREDLLRHRATEFYFDETDRETFIAQLKQHGTLTNQEILLRRKDGAPVWVLEEVSLIKEEGVPARIQGTAIDITERVRAEEALRRVDRALRTLSECNQAVVRATEKSDLLHQICQIVVQIGGYRLAWVGFAQQNEEKSVRPVAQSGFEEGYLETLDITWADTERGHGPTGTAIRSGEHFLAKDIVTDPHFAPWHAAAIQRGYASSLALPLIAEGQTFGALNIYAAESDAFDADEVKLLTELADDLAYGVMALRDRAGRVQAEAEIEAKSQFLESIIKQSPLSTFIIDAEGTCVMVNQAFLEAYHVPDESLVIGKNALTVPANIERGTTEYMQRSLSGEVVKTPEIEFTSPINGSRTVTCTTLFPIYDPSGALTNVVVMQEDVTERVQAERELQERMNELETFYRATLGREGRVIELKQEVNELLEQLDKNKKYGDHG